MEWFLHDWNIVLKWITEAHLEPCQTFKMDIFAKYLSALSHFRKAIFAKSSISDF